MITAVSDRPGASTGVIGVFVTALLALLQGFGVIHITTEQIGLVLTFLAALSALATWVLSQTTRPTTPTSASAGSLQTPPPGTVLVTQAAAAAPRSIKPGDIIASPTPPTP